MLSLLVGCLAWPASAGLPAKPADLFQTTNVWNIHLQFTPEQWQAIEPVETGEMPGRGGMRFRGPGGPGGGGGPEGPGGFGPAGLVAPTFLAGDKNGDGKLSKEEFHELGERWFAEWDKDKRGQLDFDQVRAGIDSTLSLPQPASTGRDGGNAARPGPPLQSEEGHRNGLAGASGIDFQYVHADLDFEGQQLKDVAVRYKGNGTFMESRGSIKRSLKIELNRFVKGQKVAGQTKLNLHNNVTDASWMNEVLSYQLFRDAGVPASRTAYARVFVTVSGLFDKKYFGLYSLVEDVDTHFARERFATKEGAIFKPVTGELFGYEGEDWSKYNQNYDPKTELSNEEKRRVIDFSRLVTSGSDADFAGRIGEFVNLEEFARFMSVTVWLSTLDSILMMGQNFYLYLHPQTHQFQFVPWDLDHSFGQFPMAGSQEQRENLSIQTPWRGANRFLERMFKNDTFKKLYLAALTDFSKTLFLPQRFDQQVDGIAAAIRPAVKEESEEKLARFDRVVAGEPVEHLGFHGGPGGQRQGGGRRGFGPGGFAQAAKPIKGFVIARAQSVNDQLAGKSKGEVLSEQGFGGPPGGLGRGRVFGPGMFLAHGLMDSFDRNGDGMLTQKEFLAGFDKWFADWNTDKSGLLNEAQLREGINRDLAPLRGGPPEGGPDEGLPDFGPDDEK
ncbi:MAG TPA: CotH kinase family protein [Verrucomicrobiae bacterium]|nr:CotH kinase family protein [Verrucomicrobiae bacterium]